MNCRLDTNIEEVDSDDEDGYHAEPMLEVKDPYVLRSLPVLIGSDAFHQQDNVGLVDVPSGKLFLLTSHALHFKIKTWSKSEAFKSHSSFDN